MIFIKEFYKTFWIILKYFIVFICRMYFLVWVFIHHKFLPLSTHKFLLKFAQKAQKIWKKIILFKVNHNNGQIKQVYYIRNTLHCWPVSQSYRIDGSLQKMKKNNWGVFSLFYSFWNPASFLHSWKCANSANNKTFYFNVETEDFGPQKCRNFSRVISRSSFKPAWAS